MFFHPTVLKWILYISVAKIIALKTWGLMVFMAYATLGGMILGAEWIWTSLSGLI